MERKLLAIAGLAAIFLICSCSLGLTKYPDCQSKESDDDKDACYVQKAAELADIKICDNIIDKKTAALCQMKVAEANKDLEICAKTIQDSFWKDVCMRKVAEASLNPSPCFTLISEKDENECINTVALGLNDADLCLELTEGTMLPECIAKIAVAKSDYSVCNKIKIEVNRQICYSKVAAATKDKELCQTLLTKSFRENCLASIEEAESSNKPE